MTFRDLRACVITGVILAALLLFATRSEARPSQRDANAPSVQTAQRIPVATLERYARTAIHRWLCSSNGWRCLNINRPPLAWNLDHTALTWRTYGRTSYKQGSGCVTAIWQLFCAETRRWDTSGRITARGRVTRIARHR